MEISNLSSEELVDRLILSVINYKDNEDKLDSYPVIRKGSFAVLAQLCVGEKNDAGQYTACLTVTNSMLEKWGLPKEQLFEIAADNSKKLFPVTNQPITEYLDHSYAGAAVLFPDGFDIGNISVLTNEQHFNGAATLFYDASVLDRIAKENDMIRRNKGVSGQDGN